MNPVGRFDLSPQHNISRVLKGGWQLAGGHGSVDRAQALADMAAYVRAGITTFDCADIYTGVEELIGAFLRQYGSAIRAGDLPAVQVHTKYVPDLGALAALTPADTTRTIERSLTRLGVERLDLVQFHWWDYDIPGYVEAAQQLQRLHLEGKIKHVAVTNFDAPRLREILDAGVPVVSCQVQYSPLDRRPRGELLDLCRERGIWLLCYGTVAGGFLSDRYLGAPEPHEPLSNRSLTKYKLIIDEFGGWELFQALLAALRQVADRHEASIAMVATRWTLAQERVAAAIVGARNARHLPDTLRLFDLTLSPRDLAEIDAVVSQASGPLGSVYGLERVKDGRHASIMRYNLSKDQGAKQTPDGS